MIKCSERWKYCLKKFYLLVLLRIFAKPWKISKINLSFINFYILWSDEKEFSKRIDIFKSFLARIIPCSVIFQFRVNNKFHRTLKILFLDSLGFFYFCEWWTLDSLKVRCIRSRVNLTETRVPLIEGCSLRTRVARSHRELHHSFELASFLLPRRLCTNVGIIRDASMITK